MRQLEKTVRTRKRFDEEAIEKKAKQSKRNKPVRTPRPTTEESI